MYCVNNVQMAGNSTISNCGSSTCAHAIIYQNVGDEFDLAQDPIRFHHCAYYGSRGGTYYRTLPSTNAITRPFWATSTSSSSSRDDDDDNEGWRPQRIGAAVAGAVVAFLLIFVVLPLWILKQARGGAPLGTVRYQAAPPSVTAPPVYSRVGDGVGERRTLDPRASEPKPEEVMEPPPRYEDVGGTRVVR
jgi:hypothetical protein